ncbi:MAG: hypothetical protein AAFP84_00755 [Actinomycetota bacterium]
MTAHMQPEQLPTTTNVPIARLVRTILLVNLYVQLSELVRYLVVVRPRLESELATSIDGVGRIDLVIFSIWGLWGTLLSTVLVMLYWLLANCFGSTVRSAIASGTMAWFMCFVILWVGVANMQISSWALPAIALPLAVVETVTATLFARWLLNRQGSPVRCCATS